MRRTTVLLLLFALASCGGDSGGGGATVLTGALVQPPAAQCQGCSVAGRQIQVLQLQQDQPPLAIALATPLVTDAAGNYTSADLTAELGGARNFILVAGVGQAALLGGAEEVATNGTNDKNLDVATQVACQAVVDITSGTKIATGNAPDGCEVAPNGVCETDQICWFTLDPSSMDRQRIANLEGAAALIQDRVNLQANVGHAACAVINCTFQGAGAASIECLNGFF
jgi:hypothetical protein